MKPAREHATNNQQTYFVSSQTWQRRLLFRKERWAGLFLETLYHYRQSAYPLHEFVLMPDHFHLLITPKLSLERAVQYIKGGFSYRAKHELRSNLEVWQQGFTDHRVRCWADYVNHVRYIHENPLEKRLVTSAQDYRYSSIHAEFEKDAVPQRLKPDDFNTFYGTAEAVPLQSTDSQARPSGQSAEQDGNSEEEVAQDSSTKITR
ncbi:MAG: transposase [Acidobacteriales bacterium]|nr:transposase [Terriglobales bacterium]